MLDCTSALKSPTEDRARSFLEFHARPSAAQAQAAVRTLLAWAGDDPGRPGLRDTPARVAQAYREWFSGYELDPAEILARTFDEVAGYSQEVMLRDIPIESHCEHHLAAIRGVAHIAYIPNGRVVGISKLARLADAYARRLQIQERLTAEIGTALQQVLEPKGVAVAINATHDCMSSRGVRKHGGSLVTYHFSGDYEAPRMQERFLHKIE